MGKEWEEIFKELLTEPFWNHFHLVPLLEGLSQEEINEMADKSSANDRGWAVCVEVLNTHAQEVIDEKNESERLAELVAYHPLYLATPVVQGILTKWSLLDNDEELKAKMGDLCKALRFLGSMGINRKGARRWNVAIDKMKILKQKLGEIQTAIKDDDSTKARTIHPELYAICISFCDEGHFLSGKWGVTDMAKQVLGEHLGLTFESVHDLLVEKPGYLFGDDKR